MPSFIGPVGKLRLQLYKREQEQLAQAENLLLTIERLATAAQDSESLVKAANAGHRLIAEVRKLLPPVVRNSGGAGPLPDQIDLPIPGEEPEVKREPVGKAA